MGGWGEELQERLSFGKAGPSRAGSDRMAAAGRARCDEGMGIDSRDEGFPFLPIFYEITTPPCCRPRGIFVSRRSAAQAGGISFFRSGAARVNPPPEHWTQARKFASIAAKQKPRGKTFSEKDISMQVCIAIMHGNPVLLELRDGIPHINGEAQPIKQLTEEKLAAFQQELDAIPQGDDEAGYAALVNAKRAAFIVDMLGHAVGDECVNLLTHILDHVHYDVMEYLGETEDA